MMDALSLECMSAYLCERSGTSLDLYDKFVNWTPIEAVVLRESER